MYYRIEEHVVRNIVERAQDLRESTEGLPLDVRRDIGNLLVWVADLERAVRFQDAQGDPSSARVTYPQNDFIKVIKVLREHMGLGLREAKSMTDMQPLRLTTGLVGDPERFGRMLDALRAIGCTVDLSGS